MLFVSIFYCVNNDVFHKTEFVNKKFEINELCQKYYETYLEKCKLHFEITLPTYKYHNTFTYKDNHMFNLDYGLIRMVEPDLIDEGYETEKEDSIDEKSQLI